ncbi:hypothetical protein D6D01_01052 [Aureobasidium pullulans]|uniref:Uncharacterized protein n=1 Tax=Aureobasidium pullulans TaxID=5580 RepID=A0A4V4JY48_AURPU|nr:hypothetical protein D6D01_01052 [Aureobasidium pullulans]
MSTCLTLALSISHFLRSEHTHLSSQQHNATTNFKLHHQLAKMPIYSRSLRALVILILPLNVMTLLVTTTLLPSNHLMSPLSRLSYADMETDMEIVPQQEMRAFNLLSSFVGSRCIYPGNSTFWYRRDVRFWCRRGCNFHDIAIAVDTHNYDHIQNCVSRQSRRP